MRRITEQGGDAAELMGIIGVLQSSVHRQVRKFLEPFGLTIPQYRAIAHIARQEKTEPVTISSLGEHFCVACSTASGLVDRLERDRWVERCRQEEDRRSVRIRVTEKARRILGQEIISLEAYWTMVLNTMSVRQRATIMAGLRNLREVAENLNPVDAGRARESANAGGVIKTKLRDLWREEIGAAGRYLVASQLADGNPEVVAHLRQMARDKIEHAVELRKVMGRSQSIKTYAERLETLAGRRRKMMTEIMTDGIDANLSEFLTRVILDEKRHEIWLRKIRKMLK